MLKAIGRTLSEAKVSEAHYTKLSTSPCLFLFFFYNQIERMKNLCQKQHFIENFIIFKVERHLYNNTIQKHSSYNFIVTQIHTKSCTYNYFLYVVNIHLNYSNNYKLITIFWGALTGTFLFWYSFHTNMRIMTILHFGYVSAVPVFSLERFGIMSHFTAKDKLVFLFSFM